MIQALTGLLANKKLTAAIGIGATLLGLVYSFNQITDGYYQKGYDAAVVQITKEHNEKIEKLRKKYDEDIANRIKDLKVQMQRDHAAEIERIKADRVIETRTVEVIKYVDREIPIEVPSECTELSDSVIGLLNNATKLVRQHGDSNSANAEHR